MAQKRRKFSAQFKFETVMEVMHGEKSVAQICRERDITEALSHDPLGGTSARPDDRQPSQSPALSQPHSRTYAEGG